MQPERQNAGFTLVEVLIVIVIMAILAATIVPQFFNSAGDAKASNLKFNINTLRSQIQLYMSQHGGATPSSNLTELLNMTNVAGTVGTGTGFTYGPYITGMPINPLTGSGTVRAAGANPPTTASGASDAGWLYDAPSGGIWIDDPNYLTY